MRTCSASPASLPTLLILLSTFSSTFAQADTSLSTETAPTVQIETTHSVLCSRPSRPGDRISVHYRGRLQSTGQQFDESYARGRPFTLTLGAHQVIEGWEQGLLDMCPGETRTLTIPPELGYGNAGAGGLIPGGATLIFETELMDIVGVEQETLSFPAATETVAGGWETSATGTMAAATTTKEEDVYTIATAPPEPPVGEDWTLIDEQDGEVEEEEEGEKGQDEELIPPSEPTPLHSSSSSSGPKDDPGQAECQLLGGFALIVQGALGLVALLSLVLKRWRETPKRPWKIWFFDVSKQVVGSMLTHVLNLAISMFGSGELVSIAQQAAKTAAAAQVEAAQGGKTMPNPCSYYLLNLGIDTTVGIPILYLLLKLLHTAFLYTPLARPPSSIKSGHYGSPPRTTWWLKQSLIYFLGLTGMKLFVLFLFVALPWLPWVGDWALRWTEGNEQLQIAFTMFLFPLAMNGLQYWIIDSIIKDDGGEGYQRVAQGAGEGEDDDVDEGLGRGEDGDDDDDDTVAVEDVRVKDDEERSVLSGGGGGVAVTGSRRASPKRGVKAGNKDD